MAFLRALPTLLLAGCLLALAACSTPPPPRVATRTAYKIATALLLASEDGKLTAEQLQAKRDEVVRYLTERGLLMPDDVLVNNAAAADRIIRVSIAASGGFKVTIFNPGGTGATYAAAPTIGGDVRVRVGADDYWPTYDPWFDQGYYYSPYPTPGHYRYQPRDYLRPYYPRDRFHPGESRHPPPPPTVSDPTPQPQPRPRLPGGFYNNHPSDRDEHRPDWRDRHPPRRPDTPPRGDDPQPRPAPTPPPPAIDPPQNSPEPRPAPEPRHAPERARDDERADWPRPPK